MEGRLFNFSAGPSALPTEILETAARDMLNWQGSGMGVMEMSHRSKSYDQIHNKAISDLKTLLSIPDNYKVAFMQGGASLQFACIPLNLLGEKTTANYLTTGSWGAKAIDEAKKYCTPTEVASSKAVKFTDVPAPSTWNINPEGAYFHYCANETIGGLEFDLTPEMLEKIGGMNIVADMSSNFLSKPIDVSKHAVIYAGAQKNAGPSGVTIVIAREDVLGKPLDITPSMCNWKLMFDNNSLYNTPPCYAIYMCGLYFDYMVRNGGIERFQQIAQEKASLLYSTIDNSGGFYSNPNNPAYRSNMNVPFLINGGDETLEKKFLTLAEQQGMVTLAGHRSVGGLRASIYNGLPMEGVQKLVDFMGTFKQENSS